MRERYPRDRYPAISLNPPPPKPRTQSRLIRLSQARQHALQLKREREREGEDLRLVIVWLAYDGRYDVIAENQVRRTTHVVEYV